MEAGFVESEEFLRIWGQACDHFVEWDEFCSYPLPAGADARDVWRVLQTLLREGGIKLEHPAWFSVSNATFMWFAESHELERCVHVLSGKAATDSAQARSFKKFRSRPLYYYLMRDELRAVCSRDGAELSDEDLRAIMLYGADPKTPAQHLLANLCGLFCADTDRSGEKIDERLIGNVHELLSRGVDAELRTNLEPPSPSHRPDLFPPSVVLRRIARFADGTATKSYLHPVFAFMEFSRWFWDYQPFDTLNAATDLVVRSIYCRRMGMELLELLSVSLIEERLQDLIKKSAYPQCWQPEYTVAGVNVSWYHELLTRNYLESFGQIEERMTAFLENRRRQKAAVNELGALNERQRDALLKMLKWPNVPITIEEHRRRHGTTHPTARTDLLKLEDMGFLIHRRVGKSFAFTPGPDLHRLVRP